MNLRQIQTQLPWTVKYSRDFRSNPQSHKDFAHAVVHAQKALGKLCGLVDDLDHNMDLAHEIDISRQYGKYVADLVVCALRMANECPSRKIDLQSAVIERLETKNGVKLDTPGESI